MIKKYTNQFFSFCFIMLSIGFSNAFDGTGSLTSGGITRTFTYHYPGSTLDPNLPLMIVYHGDGGTGASIRATTGFDAIADANNFFVVYPDAIGTYWNTYVDNSPGSPDDVNAPDDVLFTSDLIDELCNSFYINRDKVYATGHSAGGFMCYTLSIQLNDQIAAIAPVSANIYGDQSIIDTYFLTVPVPIPLYHIHGDADVDVDYMDVNDTPDGDEYPISMYGYINCGNDIYSESTIVSGVYKKTYCNAPIEACLIQVAGLAHAWPSTSGYNAAQSIWDFCNSYSLSVGQPCLAGLDKLTNTTDFSISPNPSNGTFIIQTSQTIEGIVLCDILGKEIPFNYNVTNNTFTFSSKTNAVYVLKVNLSNGKQLIKRVMTE